MNHKISCVAFLFLVFGCAHDKYDQKSQINSPETILGKFWETGKQNIYPQKLELKFFTQEKFNQIEKQAKSSLDLYEFSDLLNHFLSQFQVSHTHFYTDQDLEFYFFRSLFSTRDPETPKIYHIGAEYIKSNEGYTVKAVLDGFGAQRAGVRRGDIIVSINSQPFHPVLSFKNQNTSDLKVKIRRGQKLMETTIGATYSGLHRAYIDSIGNSVKVYKVKNKKVGYVHLWTGTHSESVEKLQRAVENLKSTDALILDLRDGYGGAWWDHLDPFYKNTDEYFKATWVDRGGVKTDMLVKPKVNSKAYLKPMVVLINEGVRSGKEALAFQFKKTKRAQLLGTKTAGFFVAGGAYFNEPELPYFLYLSSKGLLLDGIDIEGVGVEPDIEVTWPLKSDFKYDPQLEMAISVLSR
jgi:carboxyl-terminal processing protease